MYEDLEALEMEELEDWELDGLGEYEFDEFDGFDDFEEFEDDDLEYLGEDEFDDPEADPFLGKLIRGGVKRLRKGARRLGIPTSPNILKALARRATPPRPPEEPSPGQPELTLPVLSPAGPSVKLSLRMATSMRARLSSRPNSRLWAVIGKFWTIWSITPPERWRPRVRMLRITSGALSPARPRCYSKALCPPSKAPCPR